MQLQHNHKADNSEQHWVNFKNSDAGAFEFLYNKYSPGLYNYGSKFTKDKDLVKECLQELFVGLWDRRNSVGNPAHVKNYLYKSFRNSILKKISKLSRSETYEETENYEFQVRLTVEEALINNEMQVQVSKQLQNVIGRLTARQREAIFLKFYEQLSYEEIAEVMGITVKASYKIMARSLEYLRNNLSKDDFLILYLMLQLKLLV